MTENIELKERGTVAVMQWIAANTPQSLCCQVFSHNETPFMMVSDQTDPPLQLRIDPLETWHDVFGMKRLTVQNDGCEPHWYFYINEKFYFATLY